MISVEVAETRELTKIGHAMRSWYERYEEAQRHVASGLDVIARQRAVIERLKAHGHDTTWFEESLNLFERTQAIFEADLERIRRECH